MSIIYLAKNVYTEYIKMPKFRNKEEKLDIKWA
jgi:hypothetical protein